MEYNEAYCGDNTTFSSDEISSSLQNKEEKKKKI